MFSHEGNARSDRQNRLLAGYLASVAGYVNSTGFVLVGSYTSHVTGNVGRLANDTAVGERSAAVLALTLVAAFFSGAFVVSMILESGRFRHIARAYALALGVEGAILVAFTVLSRRLIGTHARVLDAEAALLCLAMGMQNGLVTRLSGAVVRTTHLTGVVTDLGIEAARWFRYWRKRAERPAGAKALLLTTILSGFLGGAVLGATAALHIGSGSMLLAAAAVMACAFYAIHNGRQHTSEASRVSRI